MIRRIPLLWLATVAAWLAVAPITPQPHLLEKTQMLLVGTLVRPIDIFDFALHSVPLLLLVWRLADLVLQRRSSLGK